MESLLYSMNIIYIIFSNSIFVTCLGIGFILPTIYLTLSFRYKKTKNKSLKTTKTFISAIQKFNVICLIGLSFVLIVNKDINKVKDLENEIVFYQQHKEILGLSEKDCVIRTNINRKPIFILKEECKTEDFKTLKEIKNKDDNKKYEKNDNIIFSSVFILFISFIVLFLTNKKNENSENFNKRKYFLLMYSMVFTGLLYFLNFYMLAITIALLLLSRVSFIESELKKFSVIENISNHFKLIFKNYYENNIIKKEDKIYVIKEITTCDTKIEDLKTGYIVNISTSDLFGYTNTTLSYKEENNKRVDFIFEIEKENVSEDIKIVWALNNYIKNKLKEEKFYLEEIENKLDKKYKFKIITENARNINLLKNSINKFKEEVSK